MEKFKKIVKTISTVLSHIIFWLVQISIIYWSFTTLFSIIGSMFLSDYDPDWFIELVESINEIFTYTTPLYGVGFILSIITFFVLPVLASCFVIYKSYIQKSPNFNINKVLFAEQIPIMILALFNIFQGWINVGGIGVMILFYSIVFLRLLIDTFGYKLPEIVSKVTRTVSDTTQLVVSLYFSFIMIFPMIIIMTTLFNFTIYRDTFDTQYLDYNPIEIVMYILGVFIFFPALILTISTPFTLSLFTFIKRIKQYNYISMGITTVILLLFGYGVIYLNQNYSPILHSFENQIYSKILSEKDYENKRDLKKQVVNKYSIEEFKELTNSEISNDDYYYNDSFYLNANDISVAFIEMPMTFACYGDVNSGYLKENECKKLFINFERFYVPYRHLLSFLMPLETQLDKNQVKDMLVNTIYDYQNNDYYVNYNSPDYDSKYENLTIKELKEEITYLENGVIQSEVSILVQSNVSYDDSYQIKFRLPSNSVITGLYTGDSYEKALLVPQNVAEKVYQEELAKSISFDPTVLSNEGLNRYSLKVFPVKALSQHKVKFTYTALPDYKSDYEVNGFSIYYKNGVTNNSESLIPSITKVNPDNNCYSYYTNSCSSGVFTYNNQTMYRISEFDLSNYKAENKIIMVLDSSYSMKDGFNNYLYTMEGIYDYLKSKGYSVELYSIDNKTMKLSELLKENELAGYSNRKLGFNDLFELEGIKNNKVNIIYITDSSPDIDYDDISYKSSVPETVNGISVAEKTNIISFSTIILTDDSYDSVMDILSLQTSQFLESNNAYIQLLPKNAVIYESRLNKALNNINTHMVINDYIDNLDLQNSDEILPSVQVLDDNSVLTNNLSTLRAIDIDSELSTNIAENSNYIEQILIKNYSQNLAKSFNYKNNNTQRIKIGDKIYGLGTKYNLLLPYTSFIGIETEQQKESIEIGMNSINKFSNETPTFNQIAFSGSKEVLLITVLTLLLSSSLIIILRKTVVGISNRE